MLLVETVRDANDDVVAFEKSGEGGVDEGFTHSECVGVMCKKENLFA